MLIIVFLLIGFLIYGFHHVSHNGIYMQFMSGTFSCFEDANFWGYLSHFVTARLYLMLSHIFPGWQWSTILILGILLIAIIAFCVGWRSQRRLDKVELTALPFCAVFFFWRDNLFAFDLPRYSMLICTLGLLLFQFWNNKTTPKSFPFLATFIMLFGILTRVESAIVIILLYLLMQILLAPNFFKGLVNSMIPILLLLIVLIGLKFDFATSSDYYKRLEPWGEPSMSHKFNVIPLASMKNEYDSMRYIAATNLIYDDTVTLNESFIRSIVFEPALFPKDFKVLRKMADYSIKELFSAFKLLSKSLWFALFATWIICLYLAVKIGKSSLVWIYLLAIFVGLWIIGFVASEARFIEAVLQLGSFLLLTSLLSKKGNVPKVLWVILCIPTCISAINAIDSYNKICKQEVQVDKFHKSLAKKYSNKVVVFDLNNIFLNNATPFRTISTKNFKAVLFHDAVHEMHINHVRNYFQQECKCNPYDWSSVYQYFSNQKEKIIFISTPARVQLKEDFLNKVYHESYYFEKEEGVLFISTGGDSLGCFRLCKSLL
jgi:hypothetical protein